MTTTIDQGGGIVHGIAGSDMTEIALQTDGDAGVENAIIVTGETTLMIKPRGAARTLLTLGPVVEEKITVENLQAKQRLPNLPR
jgi:hypothetical protein